MFGLTFNMPVFSSSQNVSIESEKKQAVNVPYFFATTKKTSIETKKNIESKKNVKTTLNNKQEHTI